MRSVFAAVLLLAACETSTPSDDAGSLPEQDSGLVVDAGDDDAGVDDAGFDAGSDAGLATSSQGAGKLPCTRMGSVNTTAGAKSYCVATIGSIEVKVIEPDDVLTNRAPLRLAVYVHGDGARTYLNDTAPRFHAPWTTSHHVLYVTVLAANTAFAPKPDLVLLVDAEPKVALERIHARGEGQDLFENLEALTKVREIFLSLGEPHIVVIDGAREPSAVFEDVKAKTRSLL